jgi:hypothetical protein
MVSWPVAATSGGGFRGADDRRVAVVGGLLGEVDRHVGDPGGLPTVAVLGDRQGGSDAADPTAALGLLRGEVICTRQGSEASPELGPEVPARSMSCGIA